MAKNSAVLIVVLHLASLFVVVVTDDVDNEDQFNGANKSQLRQPVTSAKTTSFEYWRNWRVLLCGLMLMSTMLVEAILIWKYEVPQGHQRSLGRQETSTDLYEDEAWKPCLKKIHPLWLLTLRISALFLLLVVLVFNIVTQGVTMLYYYTQWTFLLVIVYFVIGSVLSIHGCHQFLKRIDCGRVVPMGVHEETCTSTDPTSNTIKTINILQEHIDQNNQLRRTGGIWIYLFQIIYQIIAGAVMLTDGVFWLVIFPFLATDDFIFKNNLLTIAVHTVNLLCLLGEAAMNSMRFPWFRIFYVSLWTSIFVLFQWILHACVSTWWPYPFLNPLNRYSPIWYLIVGLMHIPCYTIFFLLIKLKHFLLSTWFPDSHNLCHKREFETLSILPLRSVILQVAQADQTLSNGV